MYTSLPTSYAGGITRDMVHVFCMSTHGRLCEVSYKYVKRFLTYGADTKSVNTQRAITPKVGKPELQFMFSVCSLMVFNICVKFHENISSGF